MKYVENCFTDSMYGEKNIKNGITVFSTLPALGDKIMMTSILKFYENQNPDEVIVYFLDELLDATDFEYYKKVYGACKFFWATDSDYAKPYDGALMFSVARESRRIAELYKIYPELPYSLIFNESYAKNLYLGKYRYITISARNLSHKTKDSGKNMTVSEFNLLIDVLYKYRGTFYDKVIIVGNDEQIQNENFDSSIIVDKRNRIDNIGSLAFIIQNSRAYIGKDSGIAHLAAVSRVPIFAWNYETVYWLPLSRYNNQNRFLFKSESDRLETSLILFLEEIRNG